MKETYWNCYDYITMGDIKLTVLKSRILTVNICFYGNKNGNIDICILTKFYFIKENRQDNIKGVKTRLYEKDD